MKKKRASMSPRASRLAVGFYCPSTSTTKEPGTIVGR